MGFTLATWRLVSRDQESRWENLVIWEVVLVQMSRLVAQRLKRLPEMRETWVQSLGWDYPPEKEMTTHSSILVWRIPWAEEPGRLQSRGSQRTGHE